MHLDTAVGKKKETVAVRRSLPVLGAVSPSDWALASADRSSVFPSDIPGS